MDSRIPSDVNDAVYRVVHDFGVEALARRTGTAAGVIYNKANPHDAGHHKPTLADALVWSQITGDYRIVAALCSALGGAFIPLHGLAKHSDSALLDLVLQHDSETGDFAAALKAALDDGRITPREFAVLNREGREAIAALLELLARLEDMSRG